MQCSKEFKQRDGLAAVKISERRDKVLYATHVLPDPSVLGIPHVRVYVVKAVRPI